jgi:hypothetical protein
MRSAAVHQAEVRISLGQRLNASAPGVWAIGECAGSPQFTKAFARGLLECAGISRDCHSLCERATTISGSRRSSI